MHPDGLLNSQRCWYGLYTCYLPPEQQLLHLRLVKQKTSLFASTFSPSFVLLYCTLSELSVTEF